MCRSGEMNFTFSAGRKCPKAGRAGVAGKKKKQQQKWNVASGNGNLLNAI